MFLNRCFLVESLLFHLSLVFFVSSFVNCYVYMIVRSSLKTTIYMKYIVYILLFPVWVTAQTYKYIGIEDGLSNRRDIQYSERCPGRLYCGFLQMKGWTDTTEDIKTL